MRTFHFTLFVSLHASGGLACGATPLASVPRHCGQFCPEEEEAACAVHAPANSTEAISAIKRVHGRRLPFGAAMSPDGREPWGVLIFRGATPTPQGRCHGRAC